jgi:hypothetical protein
VEQYRKHAADLALNWQAQPSAGPLIFRLASSNRNQARLTSKKVVRGVAPRISIGRVQYIPVSSPADSSKIGASEAIEAQPLISGFPKNSESVRATHW